MGRAVSTAAIESPATAEGFFAEYVSGNPAGAIPSQTIAVGALSPLFPVRLSEPNNAQPGYDVTPDGLRFLSAIADRASSSPPITIVQNWMAGLKK